MCSSIILNEDQNNIFEVLKKNFDNNKLETCLITGYAGTGKTTLIVEYAKFLNEHKKNVLITAPTHKAVKVLKKMFGVNKYNNFCTIHSALALKEKITISGEREFVLDVRSSPIIEDYQYIIIDEASMIDPKIFSYIYNYVQSPTTLIFVGDPLQIPPVNNDVSPVFDNKVQQSKNFTVFTLNNIVRQAQDNPIITLSAAIRRNISSNFSLFKTRAFNENKIFYYSFDYLPQLIKQYYLTSEYKEDSDYIKIVSWTNATVDYCNLIVRSILYGDEASNKLVKGEILVANDVINKHNTTTTLVLRNNSEMKVLSFEEHTKKVYGISLKYYITTVQSLEDDEIYLIDIIHEDSEDSFKELLEGLKNSAIKSGYTNDWKKYYKAGYYFANVKYAYSVSAHKAQGSSYDNCIVIESDINKNRNIVERNKIKYTACTRARENLYIID